VTQFSDERGAELRELFLETAQELLQTLNDESLKLEKQPGDGEVVRSIRRIVHTLKGDAAASGFHELSELAHELEDALAAENVGSHASLAEVAFVAADIFAAMLSSYRSQTDLPSAAPLRKLIRELTGKPKARKSRKAPKAASVSQAEWTEYEKLGMQQAVSQGKHVYHIRTQIDPSCAMPIAARQLVLKAMGEMGEILGSRPEAASTENSPNFQLLVASTKSSEDLAAKCRIPTVVSQAKVELVELEAKAAVQKAAEPEPESKPDVPEPPAMQSQLKPEAGQAAANSAPEPNQVAKQAVAAAENILRVDAERIDTVLNLVGELVIGKSMLQQALLEFSKRYPKDAMRGRFADAMAFQARVLNDLQRSVMKVRMVPVEQLFRRFPRMVRDVARECGKDVQLVLNGQDTDLDKGLLDAIAEPLTHLVRNAVGHGIESAEERTRNGKPAQGTICLDAYHQGNQVIVEVSDDGHGIDAQKVKARAVERGLLRAEEAGRLTEAEVLAFIFRPGFSTADEITEISGRGVGLDVVQSVLQRLKGVVHVDSRPGQGTTFRLQLPLTLAIIKALLFRVEQRLYAIPLNSVAEIARAHESDLHQVDGCEILQLRNQVLPVIRLGSPPAEPAEQRGGKIFVLVMSMGERKFGLLVNALEGEEELVIKALDDQTVETDLVSGASILGDGRVVLILNLAALSARFSKLRRDPESGPAFGLLLSHAERARMAQSAPGGRL
jgi:two-component system, chemotaxis family, sensor kinase CheA